MATLWTNYYETGAIILFGLGFSILLLNRNLFKKLIGINIMDSAIFLYFITKGYITGRHAPIIIDGNLNADLYVNPIPTGLMLTGIVVSVCMTAFGLALIVILYKRYGTLNIDEILNFSEGEVE